MLTRLRIENFKRLDGTDIPLQNSVVFVGQNNSGKTSALQAICLWRVGLSKWLERRGGASKAPSKNTGVGINRRDLTTVPVPASSLLWRERRTRAAKPSVGKAQGPAKTEYVYLRVTLDGLDANAAPWSLGLEFYYANDESLYCRPVGLGPSGSDRSELERNVAAASRIRVAFLPAMSGLADTEFLKQPGEIDFLIGQGQTAQVLRNLCHYLNSDPAKRKRWEQVKWELRERFDAELGDPVLNERSEITLSYRERGVELDISSAGRGLLQTLLLLAHLAANPGSTLLLDEPDAHLEIFRQRETYAMLREMAARHDCQLIVASHSEVLLEDGARANSVISFVGKPHPLLDKAQAIKALRDIGFRDYYQAEVAGWVLYVEDFTDLAILKAFATVLGHPVHRHLERPFVKYLGTNVPQDARKHYFALREAKPDLRGIALFDRLDKNLQATGGLVELMWSRREIENYFTTRNVLLRFAPGVEADTLFGYDLSQRGPAAMEEAIKKVEESLRTLEKGDGIEDPDVKASDEVLAPILKLYFAALGRSVELAKRDYYQLVRLIEPGELPQEVSEKLDAIHAVASPGA
ncbi:MAG: AAA family ATPase [Candidatus Sumerlaeia bacterium]|nr:AAA family ATPase [Candidatus Sumerlaeia bacterium]